MIRKDPARYLLPLTLAMVPVGLFSCGRENATASAETDRLEVYVSIPPQKYFVERVGGEHVNVHVVVGPGQSPHTFEPTARQMVQLSAADVFFRIGMQFERQLAEKIGAALTNLMIVDTSEGINLQPMQVASAEPVGSENDDEPAEQGQGHVHGPHCNHGHSPVQGHVHGPHCDHTTDDGLDAHTWMSPRLAIVHARNIRDTLARIDPDREDIYSRNFERFEADILEADRQIADALAPLEGREFFVFHPAFGYFANDYGLTQVAIEMGGRQPSARHLDRVIAQARQSDVRLIFVQPQFSKQGAEAVARAIDGAVVPLDPLAEDYLENLHHIAGAIRDALSHDGRLADETQERSS